MKILFVHPTAVMSISDVARGYRSALERQGHDIRDYSMRARFDYHGRALPPEVANDVATVSRQASETILNEALYHGSDLVLIVSGLNVHPIALWLLSKVDIPAAVILTESPYDDEEQKQWADLSHVGANVDLTIFTNDRFSAMRFGWHLLAPAFDSTVHYPAAPIPDEVCDVLMVGTGWGDRQSFLEAVDWTGIDLRIYGVWPQLTPDSPLFRFYRPLVVNNSRIASLYASASICLNFHRRHPNALTAGPRVYEVAACRAFQISDPRRDMTTLFGDSVPTFDTPEALGTMIRHYLQHPEERLRLVAEAYDRVRGETFDRRAEQLIAALPATLPATIPKARDTPMRAHEKQTLGMLRSEGA